MKVLKVKYVSTLCLLLGVVLLFSTSVKSKSEQAQSTESQESQYESESWQQAKLLFDAAKANDLDAFNAALAGGYKYVGPDNNSLVRFVVRFGRPEMLRALIDAGAKVDLKFERETSTSGIVIEAVKQLYWRDFSNGGRELKKKPNEEYLNALKCLKLLLENGANPNQMYIGYKHDKKTDQGAKIGGAEKPIFQGRSNSTMTEPAEAGDLEVLKLLYEYGADINEPKKYAKNTPFANAVYADKYDVIEWLMQHGADVSLRFRRPYRDPAEFIELAELNDDEMVKILLKHGVDPEKYGYLVEAVASGDKEFLDQILTAKPEINVNRVFSLSENIWYPARPLAVAICNGYEDMVSILLKHGADVCLKNLEGENAYSTMRSCKKPHLQEVLESSRPESSCVY